MSVSSFDLIVQELQKQRRVMEQLMEENSKLRQQLADLRSGRGIFIDINGKRFALKDPTPVPAPVAAPAEISPTSIPGPEVPPQTISEAPTIEISRVRPEILEMKGEERGDAPELQATSASVESIPPVATPSFLEEAMIDEFAAAMTSPQATWRGPAKKTARSVEEEKETLRRELMGSYILE